MREEVIAEQLRLQRIRQQTLETQAQAGQGITQVNPEFLAALPPAIQEEVLSQQRLEQQRQAAATANPEDPVDTAAFFQNLQPALRQAILADMEDSQISALPPELAAEAQNLRREWESRNRHMQDRFFSHQGPSTLSQILRSHQAASGSRRPVTRYAIQTVPQQSRWMTGSWPDREQAALALTSGTSTNIRARGRPLLDHEALTCLLVLLFLDEPRLNTGRLHRVFRNLCYHYQTRDWIIKALLSILERSNESRVAEILPALPSTETPAKSKRTTRASQAKQAADASKSGTGSAIGSLARIPGGTSWLNVSVDAALGCRANIFHIQRPPSGKRGYERSSNSAAITVHRQAAPIVCRHALDLLISLAKSFPGYFLPARPKDQETPQERVGVETRSRAFSSQGGASSSSAGEGTSSGPSTSGAGPSTTASTAIQNEFWELLLRLDSASSSRKGKNLSRSNSSAGVERNNESDSAHPTTFEASAFGQLLPMLDCEVVKRSTVLTDKLLRLLSLVSLGLADPNPNAAPMVENQVRLAVQVLTSKSCSEEGLEDTTALLLNLASYNDAMREMILRLLLEGAMKLAYTVQEHIASLIGELSTLNQKRVREDSTSTDDNSLARQERGLLHDRFTNDTVVVTAPSKLKGGMDLQLPSMAPLTSKTSSQAFFLRMLKVIIQLREAVRLASKKKTTRFDVESHPAPTGTAPSAPPPTQGSSTDAPGLSAEWMDTSTPGSAAAPAAEPSAEPVAESTDPAAESTVASIAMVKQPETTPAPVPQSAESQVPAAPQLQVQPTAVAAASAGSSEPQVPSETPRVGRGRGNRGSRTSRRIQQVPPSPLDQQAASSAGAAPAVTAAIGASVLEVAGEGDAMDTSSPPDAPPADFEQPYPPVYGSEYHFINPAGEQPPQQDEDLDSEDDDDDDGDDDEEAESDERPALPNLSEQLRLDGLWETLSTCLLQLADTPDHHAVLMLQPAVEAFFLVHAPPPSDRERERSASSSSRANPAVDLVPEVPAARLGSQAQSQTPGQASGNNAASSSGEEASPAALALETAPSAPALSPDQQKFLKFAETHRTVLNQILRQSTAPLADGPFAGLVDHVRILDFDVKRRYFRTELERLDEGLRREELAVHVRRSNVFEDSFRELQRRPVEEWKNRFYIVFEGEEGQDAGGLLREWYVIISREIFNPMYALFTTSPGDRVTYMINSSSHCNPNHLFYFKFVGRVIAKAIYDNKLLECYFTRSFYKHILGILVKYTDMESEDYSFYQGLVFLMENHVSALGYDLTFSAEVQEFGVTEVRDLIPNGRNIPVTEENKMDYIRLVCQMKMTGAIRKQLNAFLEGFYDIIPKRLISIFNEQELELLISGLPNVDIEDLKANTEYHKYQPTSLQIQWFWRALRSLDQADRAKFLQFVTGTSKVPLQGFGALEGMNGVQKFQIHRDDRSTDRLPSAHTCFNQLDLPVYETYDKLRTNLLKAIHECSEGFGFA